MRKETHGPTKTLLLRFDGCAEYAAYVRKHTTPQSTYTGSSWSGGQSWETQLTQAARGDTSLVKQAEELLDKIVVDAARPMPMWVNEVAGAFPSIPDYLAGQPDCMMDMQPQPSERAPIKIYVELTSSGAVDAADMVKRGTAILALALLLNRDRAVDLNVIIGFGRTPFGHQGCFAVIPLGTSPIDIALSCNALTSQSFVRSMGYQFLRQFPETQCAGNWDWDIMPDGDHNRARFVEKLRAAIGANPQDMIIPPTFMNDPAITDPLGFVRRSLAEATKAEVDAA